VTWLFGGLAAAAAGVLLAYLVVGDPRLVVLCWVLLGGFGVVCVVDTAIGVWRKRRAS